MFEANDKGEMEFTGGREDWAIAEKIAKACARFRADVEEELVADELQSCYNCRLRRWTKRSFICIGFNCRKG